MMAFLYRLVRRMLALSAKLVMTAAFMVYLLLARSFLYLLTLYVLVYFVSGHGEVKSFVQQAVSSEIPGFVTVGTMQWGPSPWTITLSGSRVHGEHTQEVIHVELFEAEVDWAATAAAVTRLALVPDAPIPILMRHVRIVKPRMHMTNGPEGLDFVRAFHIPTGLPGDPPKKIIRISHATIEGARMRIDFPEVRMDAEGIDLNLAHFLLEDIDDVYFLVSKAHIAAFDFHMLPHFRPFPSLDRLTMPVRNMEITRFQFVLNHFEALRINADLDGGTMTATYAMDFVRGQTPLWKAKLGLQLPETSTILPELFAGFVQGALDADIEGHGSLSELNLTISGRSPRFTLGGHVLEDMELETTMAPEITPEGRINHPFVLHTLSGQVFGGRLEVGPFRYVMRWAEPAAPNADGLAMPGYGTLHAFGGKLKLEGIDPWEMLGKMDLGLDEASLPFLRGATTGELWAEGHIDEETGRLALNVETEKLAFTWGRARGWPLAKTFSLSGGFGLSLGDKGATPPTKDVFEDHSLLTLEEARIDSGGDAVVVDADLDLKRGLVDAYADVRVRDLKRFLDHFGVDTVGGRAHLSRLRITNTLTNPSIDTQVSVVSTELAGNPMGNVTGNLSIRDGLLKIQGLKSKAPWGSASANGQLKLWRGDLARIDPALPFMVSDARVDNLQLRNLLPSVGVSARISVKADKIQGEATRLVETIEGSGTVRASEVKVGDDAADLVTCELVANSRMLKADDLEITLASGDIISGSVMMTKGGMKLSARVKTDELPLTAIKWFGAQGINLGGNLTADLSLDGTLKAPMLIGTLGLTDFALDPLVLGDGSFSITTAPGGRVELSALEDFPGLALLEGSHLQLEGGIPTYANFQVQASDAKIYEVLPFLAIPQTDLTTSALVEVELWPGRDYDPWKVVVDAMPGDVQLSLFDGEMAYDNLSELFMVLEPSGLFIDPVSLGVDLGDAITLCGRFDEDALWDLQVGGRINMGLMRFLKDTFSVMEGHIVIGADRATAANLGDDGCLPGDSGRVLRIQGELLSPEITGKLEMDDILLTPGALAVTLSSLTALTSCSDQERTRARSECPWARARCPGCEGSWRTANSTSGES